LLVGCTTGLVLDLLGNLFAKKSLNFEGNLRLVDVELFQELIKVATRQDAQSLQFHLLLVVSGFVGLALDKSFKITILNSILELLVELFHQTCQVLLFLVDHLGVDFQALALEGNKLATETEACATFGESPLGSVGASGRWAGRGALVLCAEIFSLGANFALALRVEREDS